MPKTNNAVEGWHMGFEATLNAVHLNIFKLVQAFHREETTAEANTEFVIASQPLPKRKEVYMDMAAQIQNFQRMRTTTLGVMKVMTKIMMNT